MENKLQVCRLCVNNDKLENLFMNKPMKHKNDDNYAINLDDKINYCFGIKVTRQDNCQMICNKCKEMLNQFYSFKLQTSEVQTFLEKIWETIDPNTDPQNITNCYKNIKSTINISPTLDETHPIRKKRQKVDDPRKSERGIINSFFKKKKTRKNVRNKNNKAATTLTNPNSNNSTCEKPDTVVTDKIIETIDQNITGKQKDSFNNIIKPKFEKNVMTFIPDPSPTNNKDTTPCLPGLNLDMEVIDKIIQESGALNGITTDVNVEQFVEKATNNILDNILKLTVSDLPSQDNKNEVIEIDSDDEENGNICAYCLAEFANNVDFEAHVTQCDMKLPSVVLVAYDNPNINEKIILKIKNTTLKNDMLMSLSLRRRIKVKSVDEINSICGLETNHSQLLNNIQNPCTSKVTAPPNNVNTFLNEFLSFYKKGREEN